MLDSERYLPRNRNVVAFRRLRSDITCYEARRVSFFTIQLFSRYRLQELNVVHHVNLSFGRGLCVDLDISAAASPQPIHVRAPSNHLRFIT